MAHTDAEHVFGLTAIDMAAASPAPSPPRTADPAASPSGPASSLPDLPGSGMSGTHLTDASPVAFASPRAAAVAAAAVAGSPATASPVRPSKALAPIPPPVASPPPPTTSSITSERPLSGTLATSPSTVAASSARRLPPIAPGGGGAAAAAAEQERTAAALTTPLSRAVTPQVANSDQRNFDGRDLHDLVKVSWQDYKDVGRIQHFLEVGLSSNTTEASTAEALLQIREASIQNPNFSITPSILAMVREHLLSRNRLLRPAAAYALAGYAANSRYGRGLMTSNIGELLPRLNSMLRCKVDSLDARYSALALHAASMHPDNKETVGRSGSIPLLINLLRQNIGRSNPAAPTYAESMEYLIGVYDVNGHNSVTSSAFSAFRPDTADSSSTADGTGAGIFGSRAESYIPASSQSGSGLAPRHSYNPSTLLGASSSIATAVAGHSLSGPLASAPSHGAPGQHQQHPHPHPHPQQPSPFHLEPPPGFNHRNGGLAGRPAGSPAGRGFGAGAGAELPTSPSKGAYVLHVRPAAAHAVAALVNLAEMPSNRQRMRDAGIAFVLEDALLSRNDNVLKERCRLLIDLLQMDTHRFKEVHAAAEMSAVATVGQAVVGFIQRGREAKSMAAAAAAAERNGITFAAPASASVTASGGIGASSAQGSLPTTESTRLAASPLAGSVSIRGSLAFNLVRQLERGDLEGDRKAGTVTLKQRANLASRSTISRAPSQAAVARATSYARKPATSVVAAAAAIASVAAAGPSGELHSTGAPLVPTSSVSRHVSTSGGAG